MTIASWFAVYFVLWWLCLFIVLPFGVRAQEESGEVVKGTEPAAPVFFRLWPKLLGTSVVAGVLLLLLMWGRSNPLIQRYWA